jgi:hypothetical protein
MKKQHKRLTSVLTLILISTFANVSSGSAIVGNIPVPVIGTAAGFYPGNEYPVIATTSVVTLAREETAINVSLLAYLLPSNAIVGSQCTGQGTLLNSKTVSTQPSIIPNVSITFTNPADSVNRVVCAFAVIATSKGLYTGPASYAIVQAKPTSATPTPTATVEKPSISKPAFATSPKVGVKAKATIKKVTMNGNEFKSRSITLYVCDKSDCSDKSESNATKYSDLKDTDAKTITMPEAKGKKDQYVVLYDRVVYGADQVSEKASSIKKLSVATASASPTVTEEVAEATPEATMEEMAQPTPEATPVEAAATSSGLPMGVILGVLGVLVITLLIVIIVLLARKKK